MLAKTTKNRKTNHKINKIYTKRNRKIHTISTKYIQKIEKYSQNQ